MIGKLKIDSSIRSSPPRKGSFQFAKPSKQVFDREETVCIVDGSAIVQLVSSFLFFAVVTTISNAKGSPIQTRPTG